MALIKAQSTAGWRLIAAPDFNGDSKPDDLLYNLNTQQKEYGISTSTFG
jgi:hypothetical protein